LNLNPIRGTPGNIQICKVDSEEQEALCRIEPAEAVKVVGVMLNMAGADKAEVEYLWKKNAAVWAQHI
jgi:hypothetical protein